MPRVLVAYTTREGHTQKVAYFIADVLRSEGLQAVLQDVGSDAQLDAHYDAMIVGAPVHFGHHDVRAAGFVVRGGAPLRTLPSAFASVSLSAASARAARRETAQRYVRAFTERTGWMPDHVWRVGGALAYTRYGLVRRLLARHVAWRARLSTDTSRDHDFTDWSRLEASVRAFARAVLDRLPEERPMAR